MLNYAKANTNTAEKIENLSVFKGCRVMNTAEFTGHGKDIMSIAESGFEDCTVLHDVDFSESEITEVPKNAFKGC